MKALGMVLASFVGLTLTVSAGRGDGGPPTGSPLIIGGGTTGGTDPEPSNPEWQARILAAYADGSVSPAERKELIRFLRSVPRSYRMRYLASWALLQGQVARIADTAVVSGLVATWAVADPASGAEWLNGLPGR
jgi:hypothetical protein